MYVESSWRIFKNSFCELAVHRTETYMWQEIFYFCDKPLWFQRIMTVQLVLNYDSSNTEYDVKVFENLVTRNIISFYIMGGTELHDSTRQLQNSKSTSFKTTFSSSVVSSGMQLNLFPGSNSILSIFCRGRNSSSGRGWSSSWASGSSHPAHLQFGAWTRWNQILVQPCSTRYRAGKGFCSEEMDQLK